MTLEEIGALSEEQVQEALRYAYLTDPTIAEAKDSGASDARTILILLVSLQTSRQQSIDLLNSIPQSLVMPILMKNEDAEAVHVPMQDHCLRFVANIDGSDTCMRCRKPHDRFWSDGAPKSPRGIKAAPLHEEEPVHCSDCLNEVTVFTHYEEHPTGTRSTVQGGPADLCDVCRELREDDA